LDDALLTVCLAFDAVLRPAPRFGEQANDFEESPFGVFLMPIRQKPDRLANRKFVGSHRTSQHSVRHVRRRPGKRGAALCAALLHLKRNRGRLALLAALHLVAKLLALVQIANSRPFDG
jgi:hypothetical protein